MKITAEMILINNARTLHMKCKAAQEDLATVKAASGENSPEYKEKLAWAHAWIGHSLPDVLECALIDLVRRGHDAPAQTTRIA